MTCGETINFFFFLKCNINITRIHLYLRLYSSVYFYIYLQQMHILLTIGNKIGYEIDVYKLVVCAYQKYTSLHYACTLCMSFKYAFGQRGPRGHRDSFNRIERCFNKHRHSTFRWLEVRVLSLLIFYTFYLAFILSMNAKFFRRYWKIFHHFRFYIDYFSGHVHGETQREPRKQWKREKKQFFSFWLSLWLSKTDSWYSNFPMGAENVWIEHQGERFFRYYMELNTWSRITCTPGEKVGICWYFSIFVLWVFWYISRCGVCCFLQQLLYLSCGTLQ